MFNEHLGVDEYIEWTTALAASIGLTGEITETQEVSKRIAENFAGV